MDLPNQEMVDPSRNENEGYEVQSKGNGRIGLQSALSKNWDLSRTHKRWKDDNVRERQENNLIVMGNLSN